MAPKTKKRRRENDLETNVAPNGGKPHRPLHDENREDAEPSDYERELDRLAAAATKR